VLVPVPLDCLRMNPLDTPEEAQSTQDKHKAPTLPRPYTLSLRHARQLPSMLWEAHVQWTPV